MSIILLFEDTPTQLEEIKNCVSREINNGASVEEFDDKIKPGKGITYERHIEQLLIDKADSIDIIACDKELGIYSNFPGLSANAISAVARNLGIPFCQYSRRVQEDIREFERFKTLRNWSSDEITLHGDDTSKWGVEIAELWRGFVQIASKYKNPNIASLKPAESLATIMGRPDTATRISLYGSGDQSVMTEILAFVNEDEDNEDEIIQRMPRVLGTWLLLSILRFPGLLVNQTAAASYLNISENEFNQSDIQKHFIDNKYNGPFSGLGDWWWRDDLENQILESGVNDGREFLKAKGIKVEPCNERDSNERAGYYCMITESPVSRANSKGNINWFPSGADLSRIRSDKFNKITSLVSM